MDTVFVKLAKPDSIFWDADQDLTISGKETVEAKNTVAVRKAIEEGRLVKVKDGQTFPDGTEDAARDEGGKEGDEGEAAGNDAPKGPSVDTPPATSDPKKK